MTPSEKNAMVDYHKICVGMVFDEVCDGSTAPRRPRTVLVQRASLYHVECLVTSGRGKGKTLRLFRAALSDPKRWTLTNEPERP